MMEGLGRVELGNTSAINQVSVVCEEQCAYHRALGDAIAINQVSVVREGQCARRCEKQGLRRFIT